MDKSLVDTDILSEVLKGRIGQPIGRADPMIAATALMSGLVLITGNTDHYERIVRLGHPLRLANWRQ